MIRIAPLKQSKGKKASRPHVTPDWGVALLTEQATDQIPMLLMGRRREMQMPRPLELTHLIPQPDGTLTTMAGMRRNTREGTVLK